MARSTSTTPRFYLRPGLHVEMYGAPYATEQISVARRPTASRRAAASR